jgi:hypothetical protein
VELAPSVRGASIWASEEISGTGLRAGVSAKPQGRYFRRFAAESGRDAGPTERQLIHTLALGPPALDENEVVIASEAKRSRAVPLTPGLLRLRLAMTTV